MHNSHNTYHTVIICLEQGIIGKSILFRFNKCVLLLFGSRV